MARIKQPKVNFIIRAPFSDKLLCWIKEEDEAYSNIDVVYISDSGISLAMLNRFKDPTTLILETYKLKHKKDFIII